MSTWPPIDPLLVSPYIQLPSVPCPQLLKGELVALRDIIFEIADAKFEDGHWWYRISFGFPQPLPIWIPEASILRARTSRELAA